MKSILKSKLVLIVTIAVMLITAGIITVVTVTGNSEAKTASKQLSLGEKYLSELDYEKAVVAFNKVIEIEPRNLQAYLGLSEAYDGLDQTENAIEALEIAVSTIIEAKEDTGEILENSEDIYIILAELFEKSGEAEKAFNILKEGYELTKSTKIAEMLGKYYPVVETSVPSGSYEEKQLVILVSISGKIHYTLDGSEPTKEATLYSEPVEIGTGNTTLKVVLENEFGELGEVRVYSYTIKDKENEVIIWKDPAFEAIVREVMAKPSGDITVKEAEEFKGSLVIYRNDIKTIDDLAWFINLDLVIVQADLIQDASVLPSNAIVDVYFNGITKISDVLDICNAEEFNKIKDLGFIINKNDQSCYVSGNENENVFVYLTYENNIQDLSEIGILKNFKTLKLLELNSSGFTDINIHELSKLTDLTALSLNDNQISDISELNKLTNLTDLSMGGNQVSDISTLSKLTNLIYLELVNNQISDISALSKLTNLTYLGLWNNQISDISTLNGLINLTDLRLDDNKISDINALRWLTNLTILGLENNKINDISALSKLTNLSYLGLSKNNIHDINEINKLINLTWLKLGDNQINNIDKLSNLTYLTSLDLGNNQIKDISTLSKLTDLTELYLNGNPINDWSPVAHITNVFGRP